MKDKIQFIMMFGKFLFHGYSLILKLLLLTGKIGTITHFGHLSLLLCATWAIIARHCK